MCYRIITKDLTNVTAAHVHAADMTDMTISDEISIPVDLAAVDSGSSVCRAQRRDDLAVLVSHPERFALVLHAVGFPEGAVGGSFTVEKSTVVMASTAPSATPVQATDAHAGMSMTSTVPLALRVLIAALVVIAVIASVAGINRRGRNPKAAS